MLLNQKVLKQQCGQRLNARAPYKVREGPMMAGKGQLQLHENISWVNFNMRKNNM